MKGSTKTQSKEDINIQKINEISYNIICFFKVKNKYPDSTESSPRKEWKRGRASC